MILIDNKPNNKPNNKSNNKSNNKITILNNHKLVIILAMMMGWLQTQTTIAQDDFSFNEGVRYSQWVINSRLNNYYANTTSCGFAVYDYGNYDTPAINRKKGKNSLDYVEGLVAKSIIEASQYYSQFAWAQPFATPWFHSIKEYGNAFASKVKTGGGSLDDLNAVKLYLPLREMTQQGALYADNNTFDNTTTALNAAITGLKAHNDTYVIKDGEMLAQTAGHDVTGGWWHKSAYKNQMWLDGSYMGPALFAELINYSGKTNNINSDDWALVTRQFVILHDLCWNNDDQLPYHAFAADGGTNSSSHSDTWAGLSSTPPYCFHSASYWGRAAGWYFLALVDVLEQMQKAGLAQSDGYELLNVYLQEMAKGLKDRQDKTTGCWYQILDETDAYSASEYNNGKSHSQTANYLESSATALFTAAYLKAIRLGMINSDEYKQVAENAYRGMISQFFAPDGDGGVHIFGSCRSAGLGGSGDSYKEGSERLRDGSKAYYLLGYDVSKVKKSDKKTEGKVMGAFIMAATEYERAHEKALLFAYDLEPTYSIQSGQMIETKAYGDTTMGEIAYQWYRMDGTQAVIVDGANNSSFAPASSGYYYCEASLAGTRVKTRTAAVMVDGVSAIYTTCSDDADNKAYSLGGHKINGYRSNMPKGVYILNGTKRIIK